MGFVFVFAFAFAFACACACAFDGFRGWCRATGAGKGRVGVRFFCCGILFLFDTLRGENGWEHSAWRRRTSIRCA